MPQTANLLTAHKAMKTAPVVALREPTSLYLDLIRFTAALTVAYGHMTQGFFSHGWVDRTMWGVKAVAVFFILSGFVIRYVTKRKSTNFLSYGIDRGSRIYSVVLPALLFTIVADSISLRLNPSYYLQGWGKALEHPALGLLANITFTSQLWFANIAPLSDGPFWSLGYECIYYAIYGCAFYLAGKRRTLWLAFLFLLAGPKILCFLPLWISGAALHDLYQRWRSSDRAFYGVTIVISVLAFFAVVLGLDATALAKCEEMLNHLREFLISIYPGFDGVKNSMYLVFIPTLLLLLWTLLLIDRLPLVVHRNVNRAIRGMGEATFPLYLFHFPFFVLVAAAIPYDRNSAPAKLSILAIIIGLSIALGGPLDRLKILM